MKNGKSVSFGCALQVVQILRGLLELTLLIGGLAQLHQLFHLVVNPEPGGPMQHFLFG